MSLAALFMLSACATSSERSERPVTLLPEPFRAIGLAIHNSRIATGIYVRHDEADDHVAIGPEAAKSDLPCCGNGTTVTWLGHSSVLLRLAGRTVLTDPIFDEGFSLISPLPHRHVSPPLKIEDLPAIDMIVLSHGDYDHLHEPSLKALARRYPDADVFLPDGLQRLAARAGFTRIHHPGSGKTETARGLAVTALPAVHHTRRNLLAIPDGKANSWEIRAGGKRVLFIGDSAYGDVYRRIGEQRGPYDLVLVPIGAFEPVTLVSDAHSNPEDAVRILRDLRAKVGIGIHWGTFALSPEPLRRPADRFLAAANGDASVRVLRIGETARLH